MIRINARLLAYTLSMGLPRGDGIRTLGIITEGPPPEQSVTITPGCEDVLDRCADL